MSAPSVKIEAAEVLPGMVLPTLGGRGQVATVIDNADPARLTFLFSNGIVATNVRPWDTFPLDSERSAL